MPSLPARRPVKPVSAFATVEAMRAKERRRANRQAPIWLTALVLVSYFGVALLEPVLPENLALVDGPIGIIIIVGTASLIRQRCWSRALMIRAAPWAFLIVVGSLIGLIGVGVPLWAMSSLARLLLALLAFFAFLHLLSEIQGLWRWAIAGTWLAWGLTAFSVLAVQSSGIRASGTFFNPNYAGHFMVVAATVIIWTNPRWAVRLPVALITLLAVLETGSFGATAMWLGIIAIVISRYVGRVGVAAIVVAVSSAAFVVLVLGVGPQEATDDQVVDDPDGEGGFEFGAGMTEQRFDRSRDSRTMRWVATLEVWAERPWGVGPGGAREREFSDHDLDAELLSTHADVLNYLVERGILGVVGFVGLWVVLFRATERRGVARLLIASYFIAGLFRDTMHYRHSWLLLALALVIDRREANIRRARRAEAEGAPSSDDGAVGEAAPRLARSVGARPTR